MDSHFKLNLKTLKKFCINTDFWFVRKDHSGEKLDRNTRNYCEGLGLGLVSVKEEILVEV